MKEKIKMRLQDYEAGKLSAEEAAKVEQELTMLEAYQEHMDEALASGERRMEPASFKELKLNPNREKQLMKRGKWKARTWNAGTIFGLVMIFIVFNSIFTAVFYDAGEPPRRDIYSDVIRSAIAVTHPNVSLNLSSSSGALLGMKFNGEMRKQVGNEFISIGDFESRLILNWTSFLQMGWTDSQMRNNVFFYPPDASIDTGNSTNAWSRLEKLPEGTVAEAYISLDKLYTTDEALQLLGSSDVQALWLAAYTGDSWEHGISSPIGFPTTPLWHYGDGVTTHQNKKKRLGLFTYSSSSSTRYPSVRTDGDGELRDANFVTTLKLLQKYDRIANRIMPFADVDRALSHIENNGVQIYGIVITGPTKELLKLQQSSFVKHIQVREARLWNWDTAVD